MFLISRDRNRLSQLCTVRETNLTAEECSQVIAIRQLTHEPITVVTGTANLGRRTKKWGGKYDALAHGVLEASPDGTTWIRVARFTAGKATGLLPGDCKHVRIRVTDDRPAMKLVVNEIQIGYDKIGSGQAQ